MLSLGVNARLRPWLQLIDDIVIINSSLMLTNSVVYCNHRPTRKLFIMTRSFSNHYCKQVKIVEYDISAWEVLRNTTSKFHSTRQYRDIIHSVNVENIYITLWKITPTTTCQILLESAETCRRYDIKHSGLLSSRTRYSYRRTCTCCRKVLILRSAVPNDSTCRCGSFMRM